ncbi:MAG TPA: hypothetical protein ENI29_05805, partial [bacterium]|nr:hypothetical protein [bacterium]
MDIQKKSILLFGIFIFIVFTFSFISADFGYNNPSLPNIEEEQIITHRNITNLNRSDFWDNLDTPADISHNDLGSFQGGQAGEYYHLNQSFFDELVSDIFNWITLDVNGSILPTLNNTFSLGSPDFLWKDLYLGNSSIYLGNYILDVFDGNFRIRNETTNIMYFNATGNEMVFT